MAENQKFKDIVEKAKSNKGAKARPSLTPTKNRVVTTSKSAETDSKNKILATQAAYNTLNEGKEKGLSKSSKAVIATSLTLAVATAVAVPLSIHLINTNNPFDITITSRFDTESQENQSVSVKPGTLISELTPIQREGFVFKGWYKDAACTIPYESNYVIQEDDMVYALLEVEVVDISLNVYINGQLTTINTQSGKTIDEALQENNIDVENINIPGYHLAGIFKDEYGEKMYPNGYILKKSDTAIYALYEINTYIFAFPQEREGYYIQDTAGELITSNPRVTYGQDFSFKLRIADGYFDNGLVVTANGEILTPVNETYTFTSIGSNFNIQVRGIKKIEDADFTVVVNGVSTKYNASSQMTLREFFTQSGLNYTEENTSGIFTNSDLTESVTFDTTIDKDATYYIYTATLEKLAFTELELTEEEAEMFGVTSAYSVSAVDYNITGDVVIPAYYNGKPVTMIGESAFCNIESEDPDTGFPILLNISSIVLPNTLTTIESFALALLPVEYINIPEGVNKILDEAFAFSNITRAILPSTLKNAGDAMFAGCGNLKEAIFMDGITSIPNYAFVRDPAIAPSALERVVIPDSVEYIGEQAFQYCDKLTEITIPSSVTTIDAQAFEGCTSLTEITIPSSVTTIGDYAFSECSGLSETTIPGSVTMMGANVFKGCNNLTIYCPDFGGAPSGWYDNWNISNCPVVWNENLRFTTTDWEGYYVGNEAIIEKYVGTSMCIDIPVEINGLTVVNVLDLANKLDAKAILAPEELVEEFEGYSGSAILCFEKASKPSGWGAKYHYGSSSSGHVYSNCTDYKYALWNVREVRENGVWCYAIHNDNTTTLLKYIGSKPHVIIPTSIDGMRVAKLGINLFAGTSVTKVLLQTAKLTKFLYQEDFISLSKFYYHTFSGASSDLTIYAGFALHYDLEGSGKYDGWNNECSVVYIPFNSDGSYDYDSIIGDWDL